MPAGLQVFDGSANLQVDITERLTVHIGTVFANKVDGSVYIGALPAGSFWALVFPTDDMFGARGNSPHVTYENGSVVWRYIGWSNYESENRAATILYGVY